MNFFSWLNKAFIDNELQNSKAPTATVMAKAPKKSAEEIYGIYHKDPLKNPPKPQRNLALNMVLLLTISFIEEAQKTQWPLPDARKAAHEKYLELCRQKQGKSEFAQRQLALAGDYPEQIKQAREAHQFLYFAQSVWSRFGSKTLIMKPDDFAKVCNKYELVCGNLSDYIGEMPTLNKAETEDAKVAFRGYGEDINNPVYVCNTIPQNLQWGGNRWSFGTPLVTDDGWFIAAPKEAFREQPKSNIDPFVFTVSECGFILIHSMWGAEAEDATIKRYEQLRDAIIGKGAIQ